MAATYLSRQEVVKIMRHVIKQRIDTNQYPNFFHFLMARKSIQPNSINLYHPEQIITIYCTAIRIPERLLVLLFRKKIRIKERDANDKRTM
ncbi:unnamed protein product [Brugia pahangi]|uniref:Uncharacterized protein n=1 Tax=Brugia pahangi TaxID=6280 RepID=A0A0N4TIN0_BRUPA|nr:unnamed protein product [Brugia pahangi]